VLRYTVQLIIVLIPFYGIYKVVYQGVVRACGRSPKAAFFFIESFGFWVWVAPLIVVAFGVLYLTRKQFKVQLYFLD